MQTVVGGNFKLEKSNVYDVLNKSHVNNDNKNTENAVETALANPSAIDSKETKYRHVITSERLIQLRKQVDEAIRERKTFTIKGGWQTIRNQFLKRGWIEKFEPMSPNKAKPPPRNANNEEDVCINLPVKQDYESQAAYILKCERTVMSRMLYSHSVDFYWNMRREQNDWHHRVAGHQIMNRFYRSLFTSKEGLNLLLQHAYWYCEPGVANITFPRCYTLGKRFPEHFSCFIDDFRMTACMGLLKWLTKKYETGDETCIKSPEGRVAHTAVQFALDRCNEYIASQKHLDIDREFNKIWNHEWDQFLKQFYLIVHENAKILENREWTLPLINAAARTTLNEMHKYWPMIDADGMKNIWILKPGNKCRGRGIQLVRHLQDVEKVVNLKLKYVVQKYIERPLLIYDTKFDIRQWFMITSTQPLNIWMYKQSYLRFSSQIFNLENFHESLHLTNHAVQCKYTNVAVRNQALPSQNMWDCETFKNYLRENGHGKKWDEVIYPGMRENIVGAMIACQDTMDRRANTFELYGADFILCENYTPYLLEINSSPDLSASTSVTSKLCPQCLQDIVKVMIDKRRNPDADTGNFELIYKQVLPRPPAYLGMSLSIRGHRIFRSHRSKPKEQKDKENTETQQHQGRSMIAEQHPNTPKLLTKNLYRGPVIGDLIDEISNVITPASPGYEFIPAVLPVTVHKKKKHVEKRERKSKSVSGSFKANNNSSKNNFVNRNQNENENNKSVDEVSKEKNIFYKKNCHFGLLNNWKLKKKLNVNHISLENKSNKLWEDNNIDAPKGKASLFNNKINVQNIKSNMALLNKKHNIQIPYSLSSINLNFSLKQRGEHDNT